MITKTSLCKRLTPTQRAYLAGLIDGEGCLTDPRHPKLYISQSNGRSLLFVKDWIGHGSVKKYYKNNNVPSNPLGYNCKPFELFVLGHSATILDFLLQIFPYLHWKKEKAKEVIEQCKKTEHYSAYKVI